MSPSLTRNVINTQDKYPDTVAASALWNREPSIERAVKLVAGAKFADFSSYYFSSYYFNSY